MSLFNRNILDFTNNASVSGKPDKSSHVLAYIGDTQTPIYIPISALKNVILPQFTSGDNLDVDVSNPDVVTYSLKDNIVLNSAELNELTVLGPITENTQVLTVNSGSSVMDVYDGGIATLLLESDVILNADSIPNNTTVKLLVVQDNMGGWKLDILNLFSPNGLLDIGSTGGSVSIITMTKINGIWYGYAIKLYELVLDPDADAFLTAAGITNATISRAINNLTLSLKANGLWNKMVGLYPFVGGTAGTHKFNLKDPQDIDAAFRITFSGAWTHNANGITGNGTNTTADTFIIPATDLTNNSTHISLYSKTNNTATVPDIQCGPDGTSLISMFTTHPTFGFLSDMYDFVANRIQAASGGSGGFFVSSRINSTDFRAFKDGIQLGSTNVTTSQGFTNLNTEKITIGNLTTARNYAFISIGTGLNTSEVSSLNTIVSTFQSELGR